MRCRTGFTLIELSIVLVIIGLIIGGILTGRDLIQASEVRATASDIEKLRTAIYTFKNKYNCLPGDCPNALVFFPSAFNGDGNNNYLPWSVQGAVESQYAAYELFESGIYKTGYSISGTTQWLKIGGIKTDGAFLFTNDLYDERGGLGQNDSNGKWENTICVGGISGGSFGGVGMTAQHAFLVDSKIDDGKASSGKVYGFDGLVAGLFTPVTQGPAAPSCLTGGGYLAGDYDKTSSTAMCRMVVYW